MAAGQQAVQQGNYADAERMFLVAVRKAEEFGLEDRRVAVSLSQLAQVYAGQGKYVEAEPVYLQALKIYQAVPANSRRCCRHAQQLGGPSSHVWPVCPSGALADAGSGYQGETPGLRPS